MHRVVYPFILLHRYQPCLAITGNSPRKLVTLCTHIYMHCDFGWATPDNRDVHEIVGVIVAFRNVHVGPRRVHMLLLSSILNTFSL